MITYHLSRGYLYQLKLFQLETPPSELMLAQRDDTAEFDDVSEAQSYKDDPEVVTYRKANKIGFCCTVTPQIKSGTVKVHLIFLKFC